MTMVRGFEIGTRAATVGTRAFQLTAGGVSKTVSLSETVGTSDLNEEVTIFEDFEWGGPINDRYDDGAGGDVDGFSAQTTTVLEGTYSLENDPAVSGSNTEAYHETDTVATPFTIDMLLRADGISASQQDNGFIYAPDPGVDEYIFRLMWDNDRIGVLDRVGGSTTNIINDPLGTSLNANETYRFEMTVDTGTVAIALYDGSGTQIHSNSVSNSSHTGDHTFGIWIANGGSHKLYWDHFRLARP